MLQGRMPMRAARRACYVRRSMEREAVSALRAAPRGLLVLLALLSLLGAGCPSNTCLLTVNGRCEWSTCPDGAEFVTAKKTCACRSDRIALNGACLTLAEANQY